MKRKRVVIIGGGYSGVAVAAQLAARPRAPEITVVERSNRFGAGVAYSTAERAHLLNVRASNMSFSVDEPDDFSRWLKSKSGATPTAFASRRAYGEYAAQKFSQARGFFGRKIKTVRGEAVACRREDDGWIVELASGKLLNADAVVLAIGHRPPVSLPVFESADIALISAWDRAALRRIPRGDVLLLGAGLTMVDVAIALAAHRRSGTIYALSRRGLTPRPHLDPHIAPPQNEIELPTSLADAVSAFRAEVKRMAEQGQPWQFAMERMRHHTAAFWQRLPLEAQRRFLRHLRPWWDVHRHRMAPEIAAQVEALKASGRLRVLAGEIVNAERRGRAFVAQHRQRGSRVRHNIDVAAIVNCTGGNMDVARTDDPLLLQMLSDGVVRPSPNGLGIELDAEARAIDGAGRPQQDVFVIGPLSQGAYWESTAVPDLRVWAAEIANRLV
ncbi:FAD/NAD(P)-binding protein [Terricaulis sp.]|uniref:FAD/NAD(P)-binding protein n=1 Tax=Terricaulis sp. TaxID=2768686 RepID=UPI002AC67E77|nr:FAD-dependent oxidoreductase [Terricaulis sp.]MDZ4693283.1 FAD/NAD(P)-binding protein [Terricaulis sp.]